MKIENISIGEVIWKVVKEKNMSKSRFAQSLNMQRQNIDKLVFEKHSLDTELLRRISETLGINFFRYYKDDECRNQIDYFPTKEVKAKLILEMGEEIKEGSLSFSFNRFDNQ